VNSKRRRTLCSPFSDIVTSHVRGCGDWSSEQELNTRPESVGRAWRSRRQEAPAKLGFNNFATQSGRIDCYELQHVKARSALGTTSLLAAQRPPIKRRYLGGDK